MHKRESAGPPWEGTKARVDANAVHPHKARVPITYMVPQPNGVNESSPGSHPEGKETQGYTKNTSRDNASANQVAGDVTHLVQTSLQTQPLLTLGWIR